MIIGLPGKDPNTGLKYPTFTIRTFIDQCQNQSWGQVMYGGAIFFGRIDCCSTSLCNSACKSSHFSSSVETIVLIIFSCSSFDKYHHFSQYDDQSFSQSSKDLSSYSIGCVWFDLDDYGFQYINLSMSSREIDEWIASSSCSKWWYACIIFATRKNNKLVYTIETFCDIIL